ncbi:MAG: Ger(x)C family spore germination protein [Thermacetogeniaceae bacterium]
MIALALAVLLLLNCAGCWDRRELDALNVATMIGVDRIVKDGKPRVLVSILSLKTVVGGAPSGGGSVVMPPSLGYVSSAEGETITDAARNIALRSPRLLYLGHAQAIVIGERMAREGIQDVIDYADRNKEIRYRTEVVTCQGSALEALESQPEYESTSAMELSKMIRNDPVRISKVVPANLFNMIYSLMTPGKDAAMPRMSLLAPPERGSSIRKGPASGEITLGKQSQQDQAGQQTGAKDQDVNPLLGVEEAQHPERKTFQVDGTAVFSGDKLVGWLNEKEGLGTMFITRQARGGEIPFAFKSPEPNASYTFRSASASVKPVISQDGITFEVMIKGSGQLTEDKNSAIDLTKESDTKAAEQLINAEAQRACQDAVTKCQSLHADIFGFGDMIHKADPVFWKQIGDRWRDYFPGVKVQVTASFTIENTGVTGEAIKTR